VAPPRTLVVVLAGGAGGRLELLTRDRAKPAVPYGGNYRLIDFPLSNCLHAGLSDVWVIQQFNPVSLSGHLANGRPWDLDRTTGGLLVLQPHRGTDREGWHSGTADALWRHAPLIRDFAPEALVVVSADAVYRLDYDQVAREHRQSGAAVTMVTTRVAREDAARYGVVDVDGSGRVTGYAYKPEEPASDLVTNEVFVFRPTPLLDLLEELADEAGEEGLSDLGTAALPRLVDAGAAVEHRLDGYWRDVGTVDAYWSSHMDLLADPAPFELDEPSWPIRTQDGGSGPARVSAKASVVDSLVAAGVRLDGTVEHSVLSRGAVVEAGAVVRDSVLLPGARVCRGARVERTILDDGVTVGAGASLGGGDAVTLIGARHRLPDGATVEAGGRLPDPDDEEG
jgi:glucose-1-phosphate adenylyltransferase